MGRGCPDTCLGYHPQVQCGSGAVGSRSGGCFHLGRYEQGASLPVVSMGGPWISVCFRASKNVVQLFGINATYQTLYLSQWHRI